MGPHTILLALAFLMLCSAGQDYYKVLGVRKKAKEREIKSAYRKLSRKYHPDKNPSKEAASKMADINNAYEVLMDKEKRKIYDRHGEEGLQEMQKKKAGGGGMDPFEMFFGGGMRRQQDEEEKRGPDLDLFVQATLKDLYLGRVVSALYRKQTLCLNYEECRTNDKACQGPGVKMVTRQLGPGFVQQIQQNDAGCGGRGFRIKRRCRACPKGLTLSGESILTFEIEPGTSDGAVITLENEGDEAVGQQPGHVNFKVKTAPHPVFTRIGADLHMEITISLSEALVKFERTIEHLDGHTVKISRKKVTIPGQILKVEQEGMPFESNPSRKGSLYVKVHVEFPKSVSEAQKKGVINLFGEPTEGGKKGKRKGKKKKRSRDDL